MDGGQCLRRSANQPSKSKLSILFESTMPVAIHFLVNVVGNAEVTDEFTITDELAGIEETCENESESALGFDEETGGADKLSCDALFATNSLFSGSDIEETKIWGTSGGKLSRGDDKDEEFDKGFEKLAAIALEVFFFGSET